MIIKGINVLNQSYPQLAEGILFNNTLAQSHTLTAWIFQRSKSDRSPLESLSDGLDGEGTLANQECIAESLSNCRSSSIKQHTTGERPLPEIETSRTALLSMKKIVGLHCIRGAHNPIATTTARSSASKIMVSLFLGLKHCGLYLTNNP